MGGEQPDLGHHKWSPPDLRDQFLELADSNTAKGPYGFNNLIVNNIVFRTRRWFPVRRPHHRRHWHHRRQQSNTRLHRGTAILNNICVGNGGRGIVVNRSDNVAAINNTLSGNAYHLDQPGAELNAVYSSNVMFRNNLVSPNRPDQALMVWDVQNVTTANNVYVASTRR